MSAIRGWLTAVFLGWAVCGAGAAMRIIYNPDTQLSNFSIEATYVDRVARAADTGNPFPGGTQSMKVTTLTSSTEGLYWRLLDGTASTWSDTPAPGNTLAYLDYSIQIEFYLSAADAVNMRYDGDVNQNLTLTALDFRFGQNADNHIRMQLRRSFFMTKDESNNLFAKTDTTGQWIVISLDRDSSGNPTGVGLGDALGGTLTSVSSDEYSLSTVGTPNWQHASFKRFESWGESIDEYSFNIGRMALVPEPGVTTVLALGALLLARARRRR